MYRQGIERELKTLSSDYGIDVETLKCWASHVQSDFELSMCRVLVNNGVHEDKLTKAFQAGVTVNTVAEMWSELTPEQRASSYINQIKQGSV
jgi:hypothetical protein